MSAGRCGGGTSCGGVPWRSAHGRAKLCTDRRPPRGRRVEAGTDSSPTPTRMSNEYASVIFVARECYVYRIPPRTSAGGYRAAEWGDMEKYLWKGRLRIVEHTDSCEIRLEDAESGACAPRSTLFY